METLDDVREFQQNGDKIYFPNLTVDCVIFGYENKQLKVLILRVSRTNKWSLPGGFIKRDESLTGAATRILQERTNLDDIFLKQFYTFGDSSYRMKTDIASDWPNLNKDSWLNQRTFSIGYYALIDSSKARIRQDLYFDDYKWVNVEEIPKDLLYDHNEQLEVALKTLRNELFHEPIGLNLLPEKFTLPEIQTLYEVIMNKKFDRRNFPNKLLSLEIIEKLDEKRNIGQHRSPYLYKFNKANYRNALIERISVAL
jgi:8-oxo-dGTP diphosphatase